MSLCDNDTGSPMSFCDTENDSRRVSDLSFAVMLSSCSTHCMSDVICQMSFCDNSSLIESHLSFIMTFSHVVEYKFRDTGINFPSIPKRVIHVEYD